VDALAVKHGTVISLRRKSWLRVGRWPTPSLGSVTAPLARLSVGSAHTRSGPLPARLYVKLSAGEAAGSGAWVSWRAPDLEASRAGDPCAGMRAAGRGWWKGTGSGADVSQQDGVLPRAAARPLPAGRVHRVLEASQPGGTPLRTAVPCSGASVTAER
jgi:hypothetical protein